LLSSDWKFHHGGVIVHDCAATSERYRELGFNIVVGPYTTPPKQPDNPMNSTVCFVEKGGILLEIMQPLEGRWVIKEFLETVGEGINHLCFQVENIREEEKRMNDLGYHAVYGADVSLGTFRYFDTRKAMGNVIVELLELKQGVTIAGDAAPR
jgi:catechol 2,3-dioxygenase-like lactoylglutathione lyase family enzyme